MSTQARRSEVVVGVDGSPASDAAVAFAAGEAALRKLAVTLIHVVAPTLASSTMGPNDTITQLQVDRARQILDDAQRIVDDMQAQKPPHVSSEMRYAGVLPTLVDASKAAQMMVIGSRGADAFREHILGSVSSGLLHHASCPVAVVHDPESENQQVGGEAPVLVGIDGSPASEAATAFAFDEASRRGVALVALHAWSDVGVFPILGMDWHQYRDEGEEVLGERLAGWQEQYPDVAVHRRIVCDVPAKWLVEESKNTQLVVLGSRGRGGFPEKHLGSVSFAVTQAVRVPAIIVRNGM